MTALRDQGIQAIRELQQNVMMAGKLLLTLAANSPRYQLTAGQIEYLKLGFHGPAGVNFRATRKPPRRGKNSAGKAAICAAGTSTSDAIAEYIDSRNRCRAASRLSNS